MGNTSKLKRLSELKFRTQRLNDEFDELCVFWAQSFEGPCVW